MERLKVRSLMMMVLLLLTLEGCATEIKNFQACGTIPGISTANDPYPAPLGAACDDFLTASPELLDKAQWFQRQAKWNEEGYAVECMTSDAIGSIKAEIEKLCSRAPCNRDTQALITSGLERIQKLGKRKKKKK